MQSHNNRCVGRNLQIKTKGGLIVRLKIIKSRKDTFCYLFSYLHYSFF